MDRSFLSDAKVVEASRAFVCIRLSTYESEEEAKILKSFFIGRSGELENTTFVLLAPDGKTKLSRAGRSPDHIFREGSGSSSEIMAKTMNQIAKRYPSKSKEEGASILPAFENFRLALNVAACDNIPLLVSFHPKEKELQRLEKDIAPFLWNPSFIGKCLYVAVKNREEFQHISGKIPESGFLMIQPGEYGLNGEILGTLPSSASQKEIETFLTQAFSAFKPDLKDHNQHVRDGRRLGIHWETVIPDTDPGPGFRPGR